jgi:hypothetical protein
MPAHSRSKNGVAPLAYVAGIHVLNATTSAKTWMAGTSPAMTVRSLVLGALRTPATHPVLKNLHQAGHR